VSKRKHDKADGDRRLCPKAITKFTVVNSSPIAAWTERACPKMLYSRLVTLSQSFTQTRKASGFWESNAATRKDQEDELIKKADRDRRLCPKAITKFTVVNSSPIAAWTERACPKMLYSRLVTLSQSFHTDS
jgi:hypothetical protein